MILNKEFSVFYQLLPGEIKFFQHSCFEESNETEIRTAQLCNRSKLFTNMAVANRQNDLENSSCLQILIQCHVINNFVETIFNIAHIRMVERNIQLTNTTNLVSV